MNSATTPRLGTRRLKAQAQAALGTKNRIMQAVIGRRIINRRHISTILTLCRLVSVESLIRFLIPPYSDKPKSVLRYTMICYGYLTP